MHLSQGYALTTIYLLAALFAPHPLKAESMPESTAVAKPHNSLSCDDCHQDRKPPISAEVGKSCRSCHDDRTGADSHPSDIPNPGKPPKGLPLSKEGNITCSTCHILHGTDPPAKMLLRKPFNDLCTTCHYPPESKEDTREPSDKPSD